MFQQTDLLQKPRVARRGVAKANARERGRFAKGHRVRVAGGLEFSEAAGLAIRRWIAAFHAGAVCVSAGKERLALSVVLVAVVVRISLVRGGRCGAGWARAARCYQQHQPQRHTTGTEREVRARALPVASPSGTLMQPRRSRNFCL